MEKPVNNDSVVSSNPAFDKCPLSNTLFFWLWPTLKSIPTLLFKNFVLTVLGDHPITYKLSQQWTVILHCALKILEILIVG